jgi:phospholipase C
MEVSLTTSALTIRRKSSSRLLLHAVGKIKDELTVSRKGTAGEWMDDPYGIRGNTFVGPGKISHSIFKLHRLIFSAGPRVPFYIISPWTRGGKFFTEYADHTSQCKIPAAPHPFIYGSNLLTQYSTIYWSVRSCAIPSKSSNLANIDRIEKLLAANGHNIQTQEISSWRREHMSDLVNAFDFENVRILGCFPYLKRS